MQLALGWEAAVSLIMNLYDIQLPLLLNSLSGLGIARAAQREPK